MKNDICKLCEKQIEYLDPEVSTGDIVLKINEIIRKLEDIENYEKQGEAGVSVARSNV